jgi:hypothetical protein
LGTYPYLPSGPSNPDTELFSLIGSHRSHRSRGRFYLLTGSNLA